jgi:hypothetical protein
MPGQDQITWIQWATLVFAAVGALGTAVAIYVSLAKHFRERNQASADEKGRWSLEVGLPL